MRFSIRLKLETTGSMVEMGTKDGNDVDSEEGTYICYASRVNNHVADHRQILGAFVYLEQHVLKSIDTVP